MHSDDSMNVQARRSDSSPSPPVVRVKPVKQAGPGKPQPDAKSVNPPQQAEKPEKPKPKVQQPRQMSLEELAENLRKLNMTFDLFEIQAKYYIDEDDHDIKVIVRNTKTGEIIRKIPPTEFSAQFETFRNNLGSAFNRLL